MAVIKLTADGSTQIGTRTLVDKGVVLYDDVARKVECYAFFVSGESAETEINEPCQWRMEYTDRSEETIGSANAPQIDGSVAGNWQKWNRAMSRFVAQAAEPQIADGVDATNGFELASGKTPSAVVFLINPRGA